MNSTTYLDANASARLLPEVTAELGRFLETAAAGKIGNPSSIHAPGREARRLINQARKRILRAFALPGVGAELGCRLVFTSGGTESIATLHKGFLSTRSQKSTIGAGSSTKKYSARIVTTAIEHEAVRAMMDEYRVAGFEIIEIPARSNGVVAAEEIVAATLASQSATELGATALVSIMAANNVTGAVQPVVAIAQELRQRGYLGPIVCDAVQLFGKHEVTVQDLLAAGVDGIALSGHKLGALPGVGAFVLNTDSAQCRFFEPLLRGGAQEERHRAGTENIAGIIAFGAAVETHFQDYAARLGTMRALRDRLAMQLLKRIPNLKIVTPLDLPDLAICNTLCVRVIGVRADDLVVALDLEGIAASTGAACSSGRQEVSHVYRGMGVDHESASEMLRFSLDWQISAAELERAAAIISQVCARISEN